MIGIIPIGGSAERMNGLPKFLLPVGDNFLLAWLYGQILRTGEVHTIAIGTAKPNQGFINAVWHFHPNTWFYGVDTATMSETVLLAREHIDMTETVLFGMPDTYWTDENVYETLLANLNGAIANVAVWKVPPHHRSKRGMCHLAVNGLIKEVIDKPPISTLAWGWGAMVWTPEFWQYIKPEDAHVGFALQRAIEAGETVRAHQFPGQYFDCGTPDEYYECIIETQGARLENSLPADH